MTATIITFPDAHERSDREFILTGSSSWTRAMDEAHSIFAEISRGIFDQGAIITRIDMLAKANAGLEAWRDDDLDHEIAGFSLREAPRILRALAGVAERHDTGNSRTA